MSEITDEVIQGRKVIFIAPDHTVIPREYCEEYLLKGYECYFVDSDFLLSLESKVEIILQVFKDPILFINIDAQLPQDKSWPSFISGLRKKYPEALLGVLYASRRTNEEKAELEHTYLYNIGIQCGCIQLEYKKRNNYNLLAEVLYANQANGRRKNVRALCNDKCSAVFNIPNQGIFATKLSDISISHFSFLVPVGKMKIETYEKIENISFSVHGLRFKSDAVLYLTRETEKGLLYVFAFHSDDGRSGLNNINRQLLLPKIYEIMNENCTDFLTGLFRTASRNHTSDVKELT